MADFLRENCGILQLITEAADMKLPPWATAVWVEVSDIE